MSFLDNLENNLKSLESREEADPGDARRREADRAQAKAVGPWADRLKASEFAGKLMQQATRAGFQIRTKVHIVWLGSTLRFEARGERLELHPLPDGVAAVMLRDGNEIERRRIDLSGDPAEIAGAWMRMVADRKRREDDEAAARLAALNEGESSLPE